MEGERGGGGTRNTILKKLDTVLFMGTIYIEKSTKVFHFVCHLEEKLLLTFFIQFKWHEENLYFHAGKFGCCERGPRFNASMEFF